MKTKTKTKTVLVRCPGSGVWVGELVKRTTNEITLKKARRLWAWKVADGRGIELVAVAKYGLDPDDSRLSPPTRVTLVGFCEIIPVKRAVALAIGRIPETLGS